MTRRAGAAPMSSVSARRPHPVADDAIRTLHITVRGPIERADLPGLSERMCALFAGHPGSVVRCEVTGVPAAAVTVEALARLQLVARRHGCRVVLRHASGELRGLVALMGLTDVLPEDPRHTTSFPAGVGGRRAGTASPCPGRT
jgi:ABC-type transporter Mla MlaB component